MSTLLEAGNKRKFEGNFQMSDLLDWVKRDALKENGKFKSRTRLHDKQKCECQFTRSKITYVFAL